MRGFSHATIFIPVSTVSARKACHNDPLSCHKYDENRLQIRSLAAYASETKKKVFA